jgi:hypothetical protein
MATAGSLDYFIRSIWQGGAGIAEAQRGIGGLGQAAKKTDVEMAVARRNTQLYNAGMRSLAKDVQTGKISMEAAEARAKGLRQELGQGETVTKQSGFRWMEMKAKLDIASQAFQTVKRVAAEVWQTVGEGAQLELAETRFEKLAGSINTTSDSILTKFAAATGGMMSNAEMVSSASQIISLGLAGNETDVVRLGNVVGQLGLDMQQVIMTFANDSKMRLDALGLSVTDVEARTKGYTDQGIAASKAFDMAVLDALEAKLELIGSAAGTTAGSMQQLEASWTNITDTGKQWMAMRLSGPIVGLSESMGAASEASDKGHSSFRNTLVVLNEIARAFGYGTVGNEAFMNSLDGSAKAADGLSEKMEKVSAEVSAGMVFASQSFSNFMSLEQMYGRQGQAIAESGRVALLRRQEAVEMYARSLGAAGSMESMYARNAQEAATASQQVSLRMQFQAEQAAAAAEAQRLVNEETAQFFNKLSGDSQLISEYASIMGGVATATSEVGGRTEEQGDELARLQGIYNRTLTSLGDYEAGIKGAALTEEGRAKKLAELNLILANTQAAMDPLLAITSEYSTATANSAPNVEMLNKKIFEQIEAHSGNAAATALAGLELGIFSEEQANAMLKAALLEEAIRKQSDSWDGTAAGIRQIQQDIQGYISTLNEIPSMISTTVHTEYTSSGNPVTSNIYEPPATAMAGGGVVRGGIPGRDSVPALLMPGERVLTVAQNRDWESGRSGGSSGGGDTYIINTRDRADLVVAQMSRRSRERRWSGK